MGKSYDLSQENVSEYFEVLIKTHAIVSVLLKVNDLETIVAKPSQAVIGDSLLLKVHLSIGAVN